MATDYEKSIDALYKDVKELRADMKAVVEALKESAKGEAGARDRGEETAKRGVARLHEAAESLKERGCDIHEHLAAAVEEKPVLTVLAALGVGVLLGEILSWRRHS